MNCKVFVATGAEVQNLGSIVTEWIRNHSDLIVIDREVYQSFCTPYQCLSIILRYEEVQIQHQYKRE